MRILIAALFVLPLALHFAVEPSYAANVCTPACKKGEVCSMNSKGETRCKKPEIVLPDCNNDPLCGLRKKHRFKGPNSIQFR